MNWVGLAGVFVPITLFASIGVILWKFFESKHKERMGIIDKGLNPADYVELYKHHAFATNPLSSLKWGLVAMFVGVGILIATVLNNWYHDEMIFPGVILLLGGIGLIVFYSIASKKIKEPQ
jgi:ABC-type polysaccharide/polyol phosphate export permease